MQKQPLEVFYKKSAPKNLAKFTEKHLWWSVFLKELQASGLHFIKKELQHNKCYTEKFGELLRTPTLKSICNIKVQRFKEMIEYIR